MGQIVLLSSFPGFSGWGGFCVLQGETGIPMEDAQWNFFASNVSGSFRSRQQTEISSFALACFKGRLGDDFLTVSIFLAFCQEGKRCKTGT